MICTKASAILLEVVNVNTVKEANNVLIHVENHFYVLDPCKGAQSIPPPWDRKPLSGLTSGST